MADLMEVTVDWTALGTPGGTSVLYFLNDDPAVVRQALNGVLDNLMPFFCDATTYTIATEGRFIDDATGTLVGAWSTGTAYSGAGEQLGEPVANAVQVLVRWTTTVIVAGRFLRGRWFLPGLAMAETEAGEVRGVTRTTMAAIVAALQGPTVNLVVWSRPTDSRVGSSGAVTGANVWAELAILRNRR